MSTAYLVRRKGEPVGHLISSLGRPVNDALAILTLFEAGRYTEAQMRRKLVVLGYRWRPDAAPEVPAGD
jgi:hypothetical protein